MPRVIMDTVGKGLGMPMQTQQQSGKYMSPNMFFKTARGWRPAIASRLEAGLEAIATRLEAIASLLRFCLAACYFGSSPS